MALNKLFRFGLINLALLAFICLSWGINFSVQPVQAQECTPSGKVRTCLMECELDSKGELRYGQGQEDYMECTDQCNEALIEEGQSLETYAECANNCEQLVDPAYFSCMDDCTKNASEDDLTCWCQTDDQWRELYAGSCRDVLEEEKEEDLNMEYLAILFPECTSEITKTADGLVRCLRSVVNYVFFLGIAVFFARVAYGFIRSTVSFSGSGLQKKIKESLVGLIIGVLFIGMPNLILNLVNPNRFLNLGYLAEFNLDQDLIDPFPGAKTKSQCDGEPSESGLIHSFTLTSGDNYKFPDIALYDCQWHVVSTGKKSHQHWTWTIFGEESEVQNTELGSTSNTDTDYIYARVASSETGVAMGWADKNRGYNSAHWEGDTLVKHNSSETGWDEPKIFGGIAAWQGGWMATGKTSWDSDPSTLQFATTSSDTPVGFGSPQPISNSFAPSAVTYRMATSPEGDVLALVGSVPKGEIYVLTFNGSQFESEKIYPAGGDDTYPGSPTVAIGPDGEIYVAWRIVGNGLYVATQDGSGWNLEMPWKAGVVTGIAISVDEEGGVHLAFQTDGKILYYYKESGGDWQEQAEIPIDGFTANLSGVGYIGDRPYMGLVIEDWTDLDNQGIPTKFFLVAGEG